MMEMRALVSHAKFLRLSHKHLKSLHNSRGCVISTYNSDGPLVSTCKYLQRCVQVLAGVHTSQLAKALLSRRFYNKGLK